MPKSPIVTAHKTKEYTIKQSKYKNVDKLPMRALINAPSNSGKTILISSMILDIYRSCFKTIIIISPSINIDPAWIPIKKYIDDNLDEYDKEIYFDEFDDESLKECIDDQKALIQNLKSKKDTKALPQMLIVLDDISDNPKMHNNKVLNSLFTRGRHSQISVIISSQKYVTLSPLIRTNLSSMYIFKIRNQMDLDTMLCELSAIFENRKTLFKIYSGATKDKYSFLFIKLTADSIDNMFYKNFDKRIQITY